MIFKSENSTFMGNCNSYDEVTGNRVVQFVYVIAWARGHLRLLVYHIKGKIIEGFVKLWYFVAFKLLIFSSRLCPLLENVSPVVRTFF